MRRLALATLALSFLAAPAAYAGAVPAAQPDITQNMKITAPKTEQVRWVRRGVVVRPVWVVGRPYPYWRRAIVRDYVRYGLRAPRPGMVWVRDGNRFLLVRTGSGVIVAIR